MQKELITIRVKETAARIQNSQINAVRSKDITKQGVRVYQNGKIGLAGAVGATPQSVLVEEAATNLQAGIDYPYPLSGNQQDHRSFNEEPLSPQELLCHAESILEILRKDYADFGFTEFISSTERCTSMKNDAGLDLQYKDADFLVNLILKEKATANLFDGALIHHCRRFDPEAFWEFNRGFLEAYRHKVQLPQGESLPVFTFSFKDMFGFLGKALNGEGYALGSSLFSGKLNQQLFSDRITIEINRNPWQKLEPFFDAEGVVLVNDSLPLVEKGKLTALLTDKKTARTHGLQHTGAATGDYDDPPAIDGPHRQSLAFRTDSWNIGAALQNQPAIFAFLYGGGEFTADGSYATPVQVSFLFDGHHLIGKLPEFTMRSHLRNMLGDDYIGTFDNDFFHMGDIPSQVQGYYMKIDRQ